MVCGLALAAPGNRLLSREPDLARTTGRVLILDNEHTLEGEIVQVGDDYRVRRAVGEVWVPGGKVLRLCANWADAYDFLSGRANSNDPDERIRLARWCQLHGLQKEALGEVNAALAMRPNHAEAGRLQSLLRRAVALAAPAAAATAPARPPASLPPVDLSTESMSGFATHIQPILMNACATCHANDRGGEFRLMRSFNGSANPRATQHNLAAVIAQIDKQRPLVSPLLVKAVSMHGTPPRVPLKGRQTAAYQHLQEWVEMTLATNPHLIEGSAVVGSEQFQREELQGGGVGRPAPSAGSATRAGMDRSRDREGITAQHRSLTVAAPMARAEENVATFRPAVSIQGEDARAAVVVSMSGQGTGILPSAPEPVQAPAVPAAPGSPRARATPKPQAPPPAEPVDSFDPAIFNRQMHPGG
jgi:hypothetical protein